MIKRTSTRKKVPVPYQEVIKIFYGRERMKNVSKLNNIRPLPLLQYLELCFKMSVTTYTISTSKIVPVWAKNTGKLIVTYKCIPIEYQHAIIRHFSMRKAKQVCKTKDIDLLSFVRYLDCCYAQKVDLWDLGCSRIEILPLPFSREVYLSDSTILAPVFEFTEFMLGNTILPTAGTL
jgi:hypothetical protein